MRTWFILSVFFFLLFGMAFTEQYIMNKFYPEIDEITNEIRNDILNEDLPDDKIKKLSQKWNSNKIAAFIFSNHENFSTYDDCINVMEEYSKINKYDFVYYKTVELENINNHLFESMKFNIKNIF